MKHTEGEDTTRFGLKGVVVLLVLLFLLSGIPLLHAQDKKEGEKKEKEKGKTKEEPKQTVITDADLDSAGKKKAQQVTPGKKATTTGSKAHQVPAGKSKSKTPVKKKPDPTKTEKYWRGLKYRLEKNIRDNKAKIKEAEDKLNRIRGLLLQASDTSVSLKYREQLESLTTTLKNYKRGLINLENELKELPDKARRAGVPKGWVR